MITELSPMQVVKFANPANADEAGERFVVLEVTGERVRVRFICSMRIAPTYIYPVADMVLASDPLEIE